MTALTIELSEDTRRGLQTIAASRGLSLSAFIEEIGRAAVTAEDAETRFRALAAGADRSAALATLARLDAAETTSC